MPNNCDFCLEPVRDDDPTAWKQVTGWVHGPKRDSLTLREPTGRVAHNECIDKARQGVLPNQEGLF